MTDGLRAETFYAGRRSALQEKTETASKFTGMYKNNINNNYYEMEILPFCSGHT